jgi:hypothetical protein
MGLIYGDLNNMSAGKRLDWLKRSVDYAPQSYEQQSKPAWPGNAPPRHAAQLPQLKCSTPPIITDGGIGFLKSDDFWPRTVTEKRS